MIKKMESFWLSVIASVPLLWGMGLLSYVLRARVHLGFWPMPYNPDPKVLPFHLHYSAIFIGIYYGWLMLMRPLAPIPPMMNHKDEVWMTGRLVLHPRNRMVLPGKTERLDS